MAQKTSTSVGANTWAGLIAAHPELYHYTNAGGLQGIVESNAFWATHYSDLNDAQEILEVKAPFARELERRFEPFIRQQRQRGGFDPASAIWKDDAAQRLAGIAVNALYKVAFEPDPKLRTAHCCVTSFCSHAKDKPYEREHGLLSQWRGYGQGDGYCLVFSTEGMTRLFERERASGFYTYTDIVPAHYPFDGAPILDSFTQLLQMTESLMKAAVQGRRDFSVDDVWLPFLRSACAFKHRGFFEEREVRMVGMAGTQAAADQLKAKGIKVARAKTLVATKRGTRERHHIVLFGKEFPPLPLERIIIGPAADQDANARFAERLTAKKVRITKSATPLIA